MLHVLLTLLWLFWQPTDGLREDPLRVDGLPPSAVFISTGQDPGVVEYWETPMLGQLAGVVRILEPADLVRLRRGLRPTEPGETDAASPRGILHLLRGRSQAEFRVMALPGRNLHILVGADGRSWAFADSVLARSGVDWDRTSWSPRPSDPGVRISRNGTAAPFELDPATVRRAFRTSYPLLKRHAPQEIIHLRPPRSHRLERPAGVVVWIGPTGDGRWPPAYETVFDELGLIVVGADRTGNDRPITDRLQVLLDAVHAAREAWLIDEQRIYAAGYSGGGRCASLLTLRLPELFAGSVSIAGLDSHHNAPTGGPGEHWPARLGKPLEPTLRLLRQRRIAAIVGDLDPNLAETTARIDLLRADGIPVQLSTVPNHAHALVSVEQFAQALRWVDEPIRFTRERAASEAEHMWKDHSGADPSEPQGRAALIAVIRKAPWSEAAWKAAERLGYPKQRFLSGSR
jgi:predicted esterase